MKNGFAVLFATLAIAATQPQSKLPAAAPHAMVVTEQHYATQVGLDRCGVRLGH
ncbi:MAG: hypothetical protein JO165_06275 [Candidatus Eremiobacteraeota bacterium]|nr:hypothetical protein [Candidatus Eremiobacteraeota bacterium]